MQVPYTQGQAYGGANAAPVDPIISRLRPRDMMGILDQSFRLYRRNFLTFLAIVAVVFVPIEILSQGLNIVSQGQLRGVQSSTAFGRGQLQSGAFTEAFVTQIILLLAIGVVAVIGSLLQ